MTILKNCTLQIGTSLILLLCSCAQPTCENSIGIFEGPGFKSGQKYILNIEGKPVLKQYFIFGHSEGKYIKRADYCCKSDSCLAVFTFERIDTSFYISSKRTTKVLLGCSMDNRPYVRTNLNKNAFIQL